MNHIWIGKLLFIFLGVSVIWKATRMTKEKHRTTDYTGGCLIDSFASLLVNLALSFLLTRLPWRVMQVVMILFGLLLIALGFRITSS